MEVRIANEGLDNFGLGLMYKEGSDELVTYQPFEVSRYRLGIVAHKGLDINSVLVLKSNHEEIQFLVENVDDSKMYLGLTRYKLVCLDNRLNIEAIFKKAGCDQRMHAKSSNDRIQNARFLITPCITVQAKTFGTRNIHQLSTINVSRSGVLLMSEETSQRVPFINNTLLELTMIRDGQWLKEPVNCIAKVVRCVENGGSITDHRKVKQFGVKIIEMSTHDEMLWESALVHIEDDVARSAA